MNSSPPARPRARDLGLRLGLLEPGTYNAITDVAGVQVGHVTVFSGNGGEAARTGVTAVLPHGGNLFRAKVRAAVHVINAFGKMAGTTQVAELGEIETPIVLTNTLQVGMAWDAVVTHALRTNPTLQSVNPIVGECNDGWLNDIRGRHVRPEDVQAAINSASSGPVAEGGVGAGTGMLLYGGWKGGIGTASRRLTAAAGEFTVGALVLGNFGGAEELTIDGVHVGRYLKPWDPPPAPVTSGGSCVIIVATDAPANTRQLLRMARRVQSGLARTGTVSFHQSGEFALAFSTANIIDFPPTSVARTVTEIVESGGPVIDELFQATVEATEEAIINALFTADTMQGYEDHIAYGIPLERVMTLLKRD